MITVIAPHARPEFAANLLDNFHRQYGVSARLLVVENGPAVGHSWPGHVSVCRSEAHQADAMNVGLEWLRQHGGGSWARFDDDDYYGDTYLVEVVDLLVQHVIVGRTWGFVLFDDGMYRFRGVENGAAERLTGGTLAAQTTDVPLFQRRPDDDIQWCRELRDTGVALWAGVHRGYCYDRRSDRHGAPRVINSPPLATRWGFGAAEYHGVVSPSYVQAPREVMQLAPDPTDDELVDELSSYPFLFGRK